MLHEHSKSDDPKINTYKTFYSYSSVKQNKKIDKLQKKKGANKT